MSGIGVGYCIISIPVIAFTIAQIGAIWVSVCFMFDVLTPSDRLGVFCRRMLEVIRLHAKSPLERLVRYWRWERKQVDDAVVDLLTPIPGPSPIAMREGSRPTETRVKSPPQMRAA